MLVLVLALVLTLLPVLLRGGRAPAHVGDKQDAAAAVLELEQCATTRRVLSASGVLVKNVTHTTPLTLFRRHEPVLGARGLATEAGARRTRTLSSAASKGVWS